MHLIDRQLMQRVIVGQAKSLL